MNNTRITVSKKGLLLVAIFLLFIFFLWGIKRSDAKPQPNSCTEAEAEGLYNIPQSSPYYRPGLDRDKNGIACQL